MDFAIVIFGTTDEHIFVNKAELSFKKGLEACEEENGDIFLQTVDEVPIAVLMKYETGYDTDWDFRFPSQITIPTEILKLMVDLAESMEDDYKYVILNGNPFLLNGNISTRVFVINEGNLSFATVTLDEVNDFAYTKRELKQLKATLPKKLQDAVDMLTVTVGKAKMELKYGHMEEEA